MAGCFRSTCNPERPSGDSSGGTKAPLNFSWGLVRSQPGNGLILVRHTGLDAEAAAVRQPKHPIDYTEQARLEFDVGCA